MSNKFNIIFFKVFSDLSFLKKLNSSRIRINLIFNFLFFIFLILFFNTQVLYSESSDIQPDDIIEWSDVKSSKGYQLQIRNNKKKVVIDDKVTETKFKVQLPEGNYELRIGVYNKFSKIVGFSDWEKITIKKVSTPTVSNANDSISEDTITKKPLKISGENFTVDTKVEFQSANEKIFPDELKFINENELEVYFKKQITIGTYDLLIINPRNKKLRKENYLSITKPVEVVQTRSEGSDDITSQTGGESLENKKYDFKFSNVVRSAILPGWGQYNKGDTKKAYFIGGAFLATAGLFTSEYSKYQTKLSKYNSEANLGLLYAFSSPVSSGRLVLFNYLQNSQNLSSAEAQLNSVNQIGLGLQLIYIYNLIDVAFSKEKSEKQEGLKIFAEETMQVYSPGLFNRGLEFGLRYDF